MHDDMLLKATLNLEGALSQEEQRLIEAHLRDCAGCRGEWAKMRAAHGALTTWGLEGAPSPELPGAARGAPTAIAPGSRGWPLLLAASLVGVVLGAGGVLGATEWGERGEVRTGGPPVVDARPVFALLLEETPASWPLTPGAMRRGYVEWRDSLAAGGVFVSGQQFTADEGWFIASDGAALPVSRVPPAIRGATTYSGLFLVHAATYEEAVAIAQGSPHLAHGAILVRGVR